ncbi:urease accessory protein UreF [Sulfitobacter sp. SK012]|uniref:urease accessory protein UreF n=1 Tax=Sulfitobacter sp. SK012 TaxID=1389005 RepID=UPI0020C74C10|nr:urease accessory UreF family protein [Sulfitobacter sp. SK012]
MAWAERTATITGQRRIRMPDTALLTLTQWFSPSFPLGAFAYSHGLETVIQNETIRTASDLQEWLEDVMAHGTGRNDAILLRAAYRCEDLTSVQSVDAHARAFAASAERLIETLDQGSAFARTTAALWDTDATPLTLPLAAGFAARQLDLPLDLTVTLYLQSFASNLVSTAVRLVPLGQTEGQAVLSALAPLCHVIARETADTSLEDLSSTAFLSDIAAMQHETLSHRIFRT